MQRSPLTEADVQKDFFLFPLVKEDTKLSNSGRRGPSGFVKNKYLENERERATKPDLEGAGAAVALVAIFAGFYAVSSMDTG